VNAATKTLVRGYNDKKFAFRRLLRLSILKDLYKVTLS
jgi:hypothetical protein